MSVSILRCIVCWAMAAILPSSLLGQSGAGQTGSTPSGAGQSVSAILHTQGGVWVNGYEARDSTAIFPGDLLETKPGYAANLSLDGTSVLVQAESVAKFQGDLLVLDHGSVSVGTSRSFKVRVNCITVVPVSNDWTQYDVTDLTGTVQVAARKNDVNIVEEVHFKKASPETEISQGNTVHEGQQSSADESQVCGAAPRPTGAGSMLSPKWIAAGAAGAGVLLWVILHGGGGKSPVSASTP